MALLRRLSVEQKRNVGHWAMELVIVVAGVLIAMWLQQWVEQRRSLATMHSAEDAIHDEVRETLKSLIWREAIRQCHLDRANELKAALTGIRDDWPGLDEGTLTVTNPAGRFGSALVVPSIYTRPADTFTDSAWNSALSTGALASMDRKRFGKLVSIYDQIHLLQRIADYEDSGASKLSAMAFSMKLTPEIRSEMLQGLYDLDRSRFMFAVWGPENLAGQMRELGWNDRAEIDRWIADDAAEDRKNGLVWRTCLAKRKNPFS